MGAVCSGGAGTRPEDETDGQAAGTVTVPGLVTSRERPDRFPERGDVDDRTHPSAAGVCLLPMQHP